MDWRAEFLLEQQDALIRMRNLLTRLCQDHGAELTPRLREDIDALLGDGPGSLLHEAAGMVIRSQRAVRRAAEEGEEPPGGTPLRLVD